MQYKDNRIYYIRYVDHVLFRDAPYRLYHPCIRETCGWIVDETPEAVWVLWDQGVERLPYERVQVRESGLVILRGDIMEMRKLEPSPACSEVQLDVPLQVFETPDPMGEGVQHLVDLLLIRPLPEDSPRVIGEDAVSQPNHPEACESIIYRLSIMVNRRVCASEGEAKNSVTVEKEGGRDRGNR